MKLKAGVCNAVAFKYPEDVSGSPACMAENDRHMTGVPLEIEKTGQTNRKMKLQYSCDPPGAAENLILPVSFYLNDWKLNTWLSDPESTVLLYNTRGLPERILNKGYEPNEYLEYSWHPYGVLSEARFLDRVTTYDYTLRLQIEQVTQPDGLTTQYTYDNFQRLASVIKPQKSTNTYTYKYGAYDGENSVLEEVDIAGSSYNLDNYFLFDGLGRSVYSKTAGHLVERNNYDGFGRLTAQKGATNSFTVSYTFDPGPSSFVNEEWVLGWPKGIGYASYIDGTGS
ncbi:MAG: RHS repeat protein [Saprospirales bacterium]|nr:RHS repeat protein [Saprospirales bacterium]